MKKRPEAVARLQWILQKICFITFKSYIPKQFFLLKKKILNQSMTSQGPPKIVQIHMNHPVLNQEIIQILSLKRAGYNGAFTTL